MRLLYCGDVMGESGRNAVAEHVPALRRRLGLDFVVVNGENAAGGFGVTEKICRGFFDWGVDVVTTGNHVWDQREVLTYINREPRLLRPCNYPKGTPGNGSGFYATADGRSVLVIQVMTRLFMEPLDDPFAALEAEMASHQLIATVDAIIVDVHGEATSEKAALAYTVDGRASMVVGSHSHVPTADTRILPGGTAFGMEKDVAIARFVTKMRTERLEPADGEGTLCAMFVETDDKTGLAKRVSPVRIGGALAAIVPD
jgi:metallophosphoesterase (TIGR00282 family)